MTSLVITIFKGPTRYFCIVFASYEKSLSRNHAQSANGAVKHMRFLGFHVLSFACPNPPVSGPRNECRLANRARRSENVGPPSSSVRVYSTTGQMNPIVFSASTGRVRRKGSRCIAPHTGQSFVTVAAWLLRNHPPGRNATIFAPDEGTDLTEPCQQRPRTIRPRCVRRKEN